MKIELNKDEIATAVLEYLQKRHQRTIYLGGVWVRDDKVVAVYHEKAPQK